MNTHTHTHRLSLWMNKRRTMESVSAIRDIGLIRSSLSLSPVFTIPQCCSLPYALLWLTITLCVFERKGILVIAVSRPLFQNKFQYIMYRWYVLWVDVQVNLQSSDRLIRILLRLKAGRFLLWRFCSVTPPCFQINYNVLRTADMSYG